MKLWTSTEVIRKDACEVETGSEPRKVEEEKEEIIFGFSPAI
jgi:hypothetical protein